MLSSLWNSVSTYGRLLRLVCTTTGSLILIITGLTAICGCERIIVLLWTISVEWRWLSWLLLIIKGIMRDHVSN